MPRNKRFAEQNLDAGRIHSARAEEENRVPTERIRSVGVEAEKERAEKLKALIGKLEESIAALN